MARSYTSRLINGKGVEVISRNFSLAPSKVAALIELPITACQISQSN